MGTATEIEIPIEGLHGKEVDLVESGSTVSQEVGFDKKATSRLVRKIDWVLLPFLSLLYLLSFLDRSSKFCAKQAKIDKTKLQNQILGMPKSPE